MRNEYDNLGMGRGGIASVEIPLIGYEGASKTKFSERPVFVDGGGRIVEESAMTQHDQRLLAARQRRQRQHADKRGGASGTTPKQLGSAASTPNFDQVQNFGAGGVVGFLVQTGATASGSAGAAGSAASAPVGANPRSG